MVQPRPEQITSPCWLKKTLSCTTNSRSRLMNLSSARACKRDDVVGTRRDVVAPGLPGIDGARRAHPVVGRRAGKHQQDMDRGRRDQPAIARRFRVGLVEIDRMILADRLAIELDRFPRQRIRNGLARLAGDDVVPDLAQIGVFPEVGLEGFRLRHVIPPVCGALSSTSANFLYRMINSPNLIIKPPRKAEVRCTHLRRASREITRRVTVIPYKVRKCRWKTAVSADFLKPPPRAPGGLARKI